MKFLKFTLVLMVFCLFSTAHALNCADYATAMGEIEYWAKSKYGDESRNPHDIYISSATGNNYVGNRPESYTALVTAVPKNPQYADMPMMGSITVMTVDCEPRPAFSSASRLK